MEVLTALKPKKTIHMKKLALIAIACITLQATAQKKNMDGPRKDRYEQFQNLSAEDMATLQTKKLILHLDLDASQQKAIQKLNLENSTVMKASMEARKAAKENGTAQRPSQEERTKMMNKRLNHQIAMKAKMKDILNAEQYEKWEKIQMRMADRQKGPQREKGDQKRMKKQG
tara:strand:+ start:64568 stop:65083 length:516 start_codon:yes stop_codon:yes gene_type:complete